MFRKMLIGFCSFVAMFTLFSTEGVAAKKFLTIGTGSVTGVYYPSGGAIARMVNTKKDKYNIRASVESTGGSVFNINAIISGDLEAGIAQSDRAYQAWAGIEEWAKKGKQTKLRSLFSLYPETVAIVVADEANIRSCANMKKKRISIGSPGSGMRSNAKDALATCGLTINDIVVEGLKSSEAAKMLQDGRIDGYFMTAAHPNGLIKEAIAGRRKVNFVPLPNISKLIADHSYYAKATIPASIYPGIKNKGDVPTFGVKAVLMSSSAVSDDVAYAIVKEVFDNLDEFKKMHPAFSSLTKKNMLEGLSAPIHPGALKYYKEVGLVK